MNGRHREVKERSRGGRPRCRCRNATSSHVIGSKPLHIAPAIGARVAHAAALAEAQGARAGLAALDAMPAEVVITYQPYWALRAHLLRRLGRTSQAREAYATAIGLSEDPAVREFLAGETPA